MSIEFIFGSMRVHNLEKETAINLFKYMLSKGLRSFHVSYEYDLIIFQVFVSSKL